MKARVSDKSSTITSASFAPDASGVCAVLAPLQTLAARQSAMFCRSWDTPPRLEWACFDDTPPGPRASSRVEGQTI